MVVDMKGNLHKMNDVTRDYYNIIVCNLFGIIDI